MKKAKVTVIVPIYNGEKYIKRCIDSLLKQTYKNLEILLINDGSKDKSLKMIKEYEKKYPELIKVFSHDNHGLGYTRNVGLDHATGSHVTFLDIDDWFLDDYIERLKEGIGNDDIVISGFRRYNYQYKFQYEKKPIVCSFSKYKYCSIAGKMYKRSFLNKNKLRYSKVKMGEDSFFNISAYAKTNKVVVLDYGGYCNYENLKSMTNDVVFSKEKSFLFILQQIVENVDTTKLKQDEFNFYLLKTLIVDLILYKNSLDSKQLIEHYHKSIKWYKKYLHMNSNKMKLYIQKGEEFKINVVINIFVMATKLHLDGLLIRLIKRLKVSMI